MSAEGADITHPVRKPSIEMNDIFIEVWGLLDKMIGRPNGIFQYYLQHTDKPVAKAAGETVMHDNRAEHIQRSYKRAMQEQAERIRKQVANREPPLTKEALISANHQILIKIVTDDLNAYYDELNILLPQLMRTSDPDDEGATAHDDVSSIMTSADAKAAIDHVYDAIGVYRALLHSSGSRSPREVSHLSKKLEVYSKKQRALFRCIELQKKISQAEAELGFLDLAKSNSYEACKALSLTDADLYTLIYHPTLSLSNRTGIGTFANCIYDFYQDAHQEMDKPQSLYAFAEFLGGFYAQCKKYCDCSDGEEAELAMIAVQQYIALIDETVSRCEKCLTDLNALKSLDRIKEELLKLKALFVPFSEEVMRLNNACHLAKSDPGASSSSSAPSSPAAKFLSLFDRKKVSRQVNGLVSPTKLSPRAGNNPDETGPDSRNASPSRSFMSLFTFGQDDTNRQVGALVSPRALTLRDDRTNCNHDADEGKKGAPPVPRLIIK